MRSIWNNQMRIFAAHAVFMIILCFLMAFPPVWYFEHEEYRGRRPPQIPRPASRSGITLGRSGPSSPFRPNSFKSDNLGLLRFNPLSTDPDPPRARSLYDNFAPTAYQTKPTKVESPSGSHQSSKSPRSEATKSSKSAQSEATKMSKRTRSEATKSPKSRASVERLSAERRSAQSSDKMSLDRTSVHSSERISGIPYEEDEIEEMIDISGRLKRSGRSRHPISPSLAASISPHHASRSERSHSRGSRRSHSAESMRSGSSSGSWMERDGGSSNGTTVRSPSETSGDDILSSLGSIAISSSDIPASPVGSDRRYNAGIGYVSGNGTPNTGSRENAFRMRRIKMKKIRDILNTMQLPRGYNFEMFSQVVNVRSKHLYQHYLVQCHARNEEELMKDPRVKSLTRDQQIYLASKQFKKRNRSTTEEEEEEEEGEEDVVFSDSEMPSPGDFTHVVYPDSSDNDMGPFSGRSYNSFASVGTFVSTDPAEEDVRASAIEMYARFRNKMQKKGMDMSQVRADLCGEYMGSGEMYGYMLCMLYGFPVKDTECLNATMIGNRRKFTDVQVFRCTYEDMEDISFVDGPGRYGYIRGTLVVGKRDLYFDPQYFIQYDPLSGNDRPALIEYDRFVPEVYRKYPDEELP